MGDMHDAHHESPAEPERTAPPAPRPQPKSAYELPSKKNTVLRNMLWALGLTMAVVVVVGIGFFGVGSDLQREPLENSELDVAASAERAQRDAPFPVAVPDDGGGMGRTLRALHGWAEPPLGGAVQRSAGDSWSPSLRSRR